jgi:ribosome-associated protein
MAKKIDATNILLEKIIAAIQDVKGEKIILLDLRKIESAICKYFVICTGASNTNVSAIEGNVKKIIVKDLGEKPSHIEGHALGEWILMDYFDVIVHIFQEKTRAFYNIEDLWGDAKFTTY